MGLAHLEWRGRGEQGPEFALDLGSNRFYRYAIGGRETTRRYDMELLAAPTHVSDVVGPLPERSMGRTTLTIPMDAFDDESRRVQVTSYRTQSMTSPAISNIIDVPRHVGGRGRGLEDLPELAFSRNNGRTDGTGTAPVRYRTRPMSEPFFLQAIIGALPSILPAVAPLIMQALPALGQLAGGLLTGGRGHAPTAGQPPAGTAPTTANAATVVAQLLAALRQAGAGQGAAEQGSAAAPVVATSHYSDAMVAPALLALLPLLQQVLTPETVQSLLQVADPNRLLGTTIEGLKAAGRLGLESAEQDNRHIRELHPGNDDPLLQGLLTTMGRSLSAETPMRGSRHAALHIDDGVTHVVSGRPRVLYLRDTDLRPQISVETPRPIATAILELRLKDRDTLEVLHHAKARLRDVGSGVLEGTPSVPRDVLQGMAPGEYLLCATLRWKTPSGDVVGADRRQLITLVGRRIFDRFEPGGELVPLNDVVRHRDFWHQIWRADLTEPKHRYQVAARYLFTVEPVGSPAGRMTTDVAERATNGRVDLRVRSGAALTTDQLNALLADLGRHPLDADQLLAMDDPDVLAGMAGEARGQGRISGRPGRSASLWVYPEVRLQPLVLQKVTEALPSGQVTSLSPEQVEFPVPSLIHLIGTRSE